MKIYKGIDLLDKIFEFSEMTPDTKLWTATALKNNRSRLIRFQQINALLKAFFEIDPAKDFIGKTKRLFSDNKGETLHTILSGDFLEKMKVEDFSELIDLMKTTVSGSEKFQIEEREIYIGTLRMPYQQLIDYKKNLRRLLTFNSGWIEASSMTSKFSIYVTNSITNNLTDKYCKLDQALELFVNPKKLSFTEEELRAKYDFPTDNLLDVDMENW